MNSSFCHALVGAIRSLVNGLYDSHNIEMPAYNDALQYLDEAESDIDDY